MDIGPQVVLQTGDLAKGCQPRTIKNFYVDTFYLGLGHILWNNLYRIKWIWELQIRMSGVPVCQLPQKWLKTVLL